jgi:hypothetical protein
VKINKRQVQIKIKIAARQKTLRDGEASGALRIASMGFNSKCFSLICMIKHCYSYSSVLQMRGATQSLNNDAFTKQLNKRTVGPFKKYKLK